MSKPESFEWHGYRFEWTEFDMPHGSCEHYEGWATSQRTFVRGDATWQRVGTALAPDIAKAKYLLLSELRGRLIVMRHQLAKAETTADVMAAELGLASSTVT
jgi:hypothetical protein